MFFCCLQDPDVYLGLDQHWIINIDLSFKAFILPRDREYCVTADDLNPAEEAFLNLAQPKSLLNYVLYIVTILIGDAFMVSSL